MFSQAELTSPRVTTSSSEYRIGLKSRSVIAEINALSPGRLASSERRSSISQPHCTPRDTAGSLLLVAASRPLDDCACGSLLVHLISDIQRPQNEAVPVGVWDNTPCTSPQNCATRHSPDTELVVRTRPTPLIESTGRVSCSTKPHPTAGDSMPTATCTPVRGEGRRPAAGAAKARGPRLQPS